jgi:ATP-binding cassette subfamily F protein uup
MIEWLESYFLKKTLPCLWLRTTAFPRACNEIIELDNGKIYQYKGNYLLIEKKKNELHQKMRVWTKLKPFVKELEWMRRQPKQEQRNLNPKTIL